MTPVRTMLAMNEMTTMTASCLNACNTREIFDDLSVAALQAGSYVKPTLSLDTNYKSDLLFRMLRRSEGV